jgi:hypothetical protein
MDGRKGGREEGRKEGRKEERGKIVTLSLKKSRL